MPVPDLFLQGVARGWQVIDAATLENETTLEADVIIIGTGAGGGLGQWRDRLDQGIARSNGNTGFRIGVVIRLILLFTHNLCD